MANRVVHVVVVLEVPDHVTDEQVQDALFDTGWKVSEQIDVEASYTSLVNAVASAAVVEAKKAWAEDKARREAAEVDDGE